MERELGRTDAGCQGHKLTLRMGAPAALPRASLHPQMIESVPSLPGSHVEGLRSCWRGGWRGDCAHIQREGAATYDVHIRGRKMAAQRPYESLQLQTGIGMPLQLHACSGVAKKSPLMSANQGSVHELSLALL